jgi:hypothetical protein
MLESKATPVSAAAMVDAVFWARLLAETVTVLP